MAATRQRCIVLRTLIQFALLFGCLLPTPSQGQTPQGTKISDCATDCRWPSINDNGTVVWSMMENGHWHVFKSDGKGGAPTKGAPNDEHNYMYPVIADNGDVVYLKDGVGGGAGLAVYRYSNNTETVIEFSSACAPSTCNLARTAGSHFGISPVSGKTISYFDFTGKPRTFDADGKSIAAFDSSWDFPDINESDQVLVGSSSHVYLMTLSGLGQDPSGALHTFPNPGGPSNPIFGRLNDNGGVVLVSGVSGPLGPSSGTVTYYAPPAYDEESATVVGPGFWADINNSTLVYETDANSLDPMNPDTTHQIYTVPLTCGPVPLPKVWKQFSADTTGTWTMAHNMGAFPCVGYDGFYYDWEDHPDGFDKGDVTKYGCTDTDNDYYRIANKGCALVSLAMALAYAGVPVIDPGWLNGQLIGLGYGAGYDIGSRDNTKGHDVLFDIAARHLLGAYNRPNRWHDLETSDTRQLRSTVCQGFPVITGVKYDEKNRDPDHWVLVTGVDANGKFIIQDPGKAQVNNHKLLSDYPGTFVTRGYVDDGSASPGSQSLVSARVLQPRGTAGSGTSDQSSLSIDAGNSEVLVTDASGRRCGFDPVSQQDVMEIPGCGYWRTALVDIATGLDGPELDRVLTIDQPTQSVYRLAVPASDTGAYNINIVPFSQDGSEQAPVLVSGAQTPGSPPSVNLGYTPQPGGTLVLNPPIITGVAPSVGQQGATLANVTITGVDTNFVQGSATVSFGSGITVNSVTVNSAASATVSITIASSAPAGPHTVTVTTGAGTATLAGGFTVLATVPGTPPLVWLGGGHTGGVSAVAAAPDGTVWSAGGDGTIKQWNAANMSMIRTLPFAPSSGTAFASNGQQGLVIDSNGVQVVSLADGSVSRTFGLGDLGSGADRPAISANGQTVAFERTNWGPNVLVFANGQGPERGILTSTFDGDGYWWGGVSALAVSADGQYVAAVLSIDYQTPGTIRLYRVSDGTLIRLLTHNTTNVQALAFSPDGTFLASSSSDGKLNVLRLSDLVVVSSISVFESGTPAPGTALAFSPDGTRIALGESYAARIYHLPDGASLGRIPGTTTAVAFTPDGQWLVAGGNRDVRLWLVATLAPLPTVTTHSGSITAVAYSPRGDLVASASTDFTVKLRSAVDGSLVASLSGHTDVVNALAFSPDGDMLATGSSDHTIRIWRTSDFTLLNTLTGHTQAVRALAFSPDGSLLASGGSAPEQVVRLWSVGGMWSNTSTLTGTGGGVTSVQFSPDGQSLAGASDGGIVRIWQTATGALSSTYLAPSQGAMSLAFSPDGQLLVAGWGQNILVFQGTQTAPVYTVAAHGKNGTVVAYSPDGQRVLSGNPDGTLKLWNPAGWGLVTSYTQETNAGGTGVTSVGYAPDGTRFVYGRGDATIGVVSTGSTALPATVTVTTNPPGLAMTVDGTAYTGPHTFVWTPGASHSVSVASPQGSNGTREVFLGWSDAGGQSHTVTPMQSRIYTANFVTQYLLTSQVTPAGGGSVGIAPSSADGYYAAGTVVQLTETPATGYVFGSWSGDASGTVHAVSVSMTQPRSVTARFSGVAMADIAVAMAASRSQVNSGSPLAFSVTVTNLGPGASGSLTLIADLPAAFSFVSASSSQGSCSGTVQVSCLLGTIPATGVVTATINVTPIATGSISMTASVDGGTADPNPNNNSATVTVTVLPAGLPPILWMGGSPFLGGDWTPQAVQTTSDGLIWVAGPKELVLRRASDLRLMRTLAPDMDSSGEYDFAVTPDGSSFAYSSGTKLGVYRSDGSLIVSFADPGESDFAISPDGQTIVSENRPGCWVSGCPYYIGNVTNNSQLGENVFSSGPGALSPDGTLLAVTYNDRDHPRVDVHNTADLSLERSLTGLTDANVAKFSQDGSLLMVAGGTQLLVWRVSDLLLLQDFTFPNYYPYNSAISADGQFVAHGSSTSVQVWRVSDGSSVASFPADCGYGIGFTPDDRSLVCVGRYVTLFGLPQGVLSPYRTGNAYPLYAIAYSPAGNLIATGGSDGIISVWDASAGRVLSQVPLNWSGNHAILGLAFSPDGTRLAAGVDNNVTVWNTSGYGVAATLTGHVAPVTAVAFSPDGTLVASASWSPEQVVKLWSTQTWTLVRTLIGASNGLRSVQFSPDGTKVVASGDDGIAREWNVTTGSVVHSYFASGQGAMRIQYSPDGAKLAAGWTGKVLLFNSGTSAPFQTLNAHSQNNTTVAWSPDSKRLISGNPDGTVDVWDTGTWGQLSQYNSETYAQNGGVLTVAYSPDNSQFAYGRADSVVVAVDSGSSPTGTLTTVTTDPQGLNIVVDGATAAGPQTFRWAAGTTHTIGAPSPQASSGTRNVFGSWSDGGTQSHTITTPSTGSTYTAHFNQQYLLTLSVSPAGTGSILVTPTSPDGYYNSGTAVQAVATANLGYVLGTWSGDAAGTANPVSVAMTGPRNVVANYSSLPTTVVTTSPPGLLVTVDGAQYTAPQSFNWAAGTSHTVAVTASQGTRTSRYAFANWGDGGAMSHAITAPSLSATYTANFTAQYPLGTVVNPAGAGSITANPSSAEGYYDAGTAVQVTAAAAAGYQFVSWTGNASGTAVSQTVTLTEAQTVTANFILLATAPGLMSPANGATGVLVAPTLTWNASPGATSYDVYFGASSSPPLARNTAGTSYAPGTLSQHTTYYWRIVAHSGSSSASSDTWSFTTGIPATGARFVPATPCRVVDTRRAAGPFGGPTMTAGSMRSFAIPQSGCGIPSTAQAYALNVTVVPEGPLSFLTLWPAGAAQPGVSTLNSFGGLVVANAAIVPAGSGGGVSVYVTDETDVILDINGYFDATASPGSSSFYAAAPCRVADTRGATGQFGGSFMSTDQTRDFPIPLSSCAIPATASAYSLNVTVVPHTDYLGYLTTWPTGKAQPNVSTLNSWTGKIVANAAIVPGGSNESVSVFVTDPTDVILDINGYFGQPGLAGALSFYPVTPCRVADTRWAAGSFGGPEMEAGTARSFAIPASGCNLPSTAAAYSLNVTVVPDGPLSFLTAWPTGSGQPGVSTLNAFDGSVVANAAIVPAGTSGAIGIYVTDRTQVILDINGYFAP